MRIGFCGINLEANADAPSTRLGDFADRLLCENQDLEQYLAATQNGFARQARLLGHEVIPLLLADADAGGPCDHQVFEHLWARLEGQIAAAGPLDAIFVLGHGAGTTTETADMDGLYLQRLRDRIGHRRPLVAELDYHANISPAMFEAANALIGYRTNPHTDQHERGAEAARLLHALSAHRSGHAPLHGAWLRLPLLIPQTAQLTTAGEPMGDVIDEIETLLADGLTSASVFPGFVPGDTPDNGVSITAYSRISAEAATAAVSHIATAVWSRRDRFRRPLASIGAAVDAALRATADAPLILADVADNPGGGGRGNTTRLLAALLAGDVTGLRCGPLYDPALVAHLAGATVHDRVEVCVNKDDSVLYSDPLPLAGRLATWGPVRFVARDGTARGETIDLGQCALLDLGRDNLVGFSSLRHQTLSLQYLEAMGMGLKDGRVFLVKSRGHFRAGFASLANADILEVDAPGLTSPSLDRPFCRIQRPIYPLDPDACWHPRDIRVRLG